MNGCWWVYWHVHNLPNRKWGRHSRVKFVKSLSPQYVLQPCHLYSGESQYGGFFRVELAMVSKCHSHWSMNLHFLLTAFISINLGFSSMVFPRIQGYMYSTAITSSSFTLNYCVLSVYLANPDPPNRQIIEESPVTVGEAGEAEPRSPAPSRSRARWREYFGHIFSSSQMKVL